MGCKTGGGYGRMLITVRNGIRICLAPGRAQICYVGAERIQKVRQAMKWYQENKLLVMSKDMKYKDSLEAVGRLLEQAGLSYSKIRFHMQPEWPFSDPAEAEAHAGRLVCSVPWLKAYEVVRAGGPGEAGKVRLFTNLSEFGGPEGQPGFEEMVLFMRKLTNALCPREIAVGLNVLEPAQAGETADSGNTAESACFSREAPGYPGNYFENMVVITRNAGASFFRIVLRLEVDRQGSLSIPFKRLEELFQEQMGTLTDCRYVEALAVEELEEARFCGQRADRELVRLNQELKALILPHQFSRSLSPTRKGCSVKRAFTGAFKGTGFEFLDSRNFCFKAQMKSVHGYVYRISIDYGGHIWHRHTFILEVSGINFNRQLLRVDGLSPQSQEECRMNLENLRTQTMFLQERAESVLLEYYGETPGWYQVYHKYV